MPTNDIMILIREMNEGMKFICWSMLFLGVMMSLLSYFISINNKNKKKKNHEIGGGNVRETLPTPPITNILLGHMPLFLLKDFRLSLYRLSRQYCNGYGQTRWRMMNRHGMCVTDYRDARAVLNGTNHRNPAWIPRIHISKFLGPDNIGLLTGTEWKFHRASILRSFNPSVIRNSQKAILTVMDTLLTALEKDIVSEERYNNGVSRCTREIESIMKMITIDIFGRVALSHDFGCCANLKASKVASAFNFLGDEFNRRLCNPFAFDNMFYWIPTKLNHRHRNERSLIRNLLEDLIVKRQQQKSQRTSKEGENNKNNMTMESQDLLSHLLRAVESDKDWGRSKENLSDLLSDMLMSLLFAGYDTTSITLTYALYHVATMPHIEEKCLQEILSVVSHDNDDDDDDYDSIDPDSLQYCKAVILETLRLYPPAPFTSRNLTKTSKLRGGLVAPTDIQCIIPIWTIQRMEEHFERPNEFHPERWTCWDNDEKLWKTRKDDIDTKNNGDNNNDGSSAIAAANRKAFFAFSGGGRNCPGMNFAMTEATLVFSKLVQYLKFEVPHDYELVPVRSGLVQHPRDGIPMILTLREKEGEKLVK